MSPDGKHLFPVLAVNISAAAVLAWAEYNYSVLSTVWRADGSHLVGVIAACVVAGLAALLRGDDRSFQLSRHFSVGFGLLGTVLGFIVALSAIRPETAADPSTLPGTITELTRGLGIALYTTLIGLSGAMWLALCRRIHG